MPGSAMFREARRLRAAVLRARPGWRPNPEAGAVELARLRDDLRPLVVPEELADLLQVCDGQADTDRTWAFLTGGEFLGTARIGRETRQRRQIARTGSADLLPWCPAWVVISSAGWTHSALVVGDQPAATAPVVDLTYGNPAYRIVSASLTALVAASAAAWEQGLAGPGEPELTGPQWQAAWDELVREAERRYPGPDGWSVGDEVDLLSVGWPTTWPQDHAPGELVPSAPGRLVDGAGCARAVVLDRVGRRLLVADGTARLWVHLSAGHERGRDLPVGSSAVFSVAQLPPGVQRSSGTPSPLDRVTHRVTGVWDIVGPAG